MIPTVNLAGLGFIILVSIGLPIGLYLIYRQRLRAFPFFPAISGIAAYLLFGYIIEAFAGQQVLYAFNALPDTNPVLYIVLILLIAGIVEGAARIVSLLLMRMRLVRDPDRPVSEIGVGISFAIGFGGLEAALMVGYNAFNNLRIALMLNEQGLDGILQNFEEGARDIARQQLLAMAEAPAYLYFMTGLERVAMLLLQVALAVIVWMVVTNRLKWPYFLLSIACHMLCMLPTALYNVGAVNIFVGEIGLFAIAGGVIFLSYRLYKKYWDTMPPLRKRVKPEPAAPVLSENGPDSGSGETPPEE